MVNKCSAYGCKSGYKTDNTDSNVTFHAYPRDPELRDKWIRANPRKDFIPSKHSRLCSLHFQPTDFVEVRQDTNQRRRKKKSEAPLRRLLKDGVIPSVFREAPEYLSRGAQTPRTTTKSSSSSRREAQQQRLQDLEDSFRVADDITDSSLHDIRDRLAAEETLPQGFTTSIAGDLLHVFVMRVTDSIPSVSACVTVHTDLSVVCVLADNIVPACHYKDLVSDRLKFFSQLINLLARVNSWLSDSASRSSDFYVKNALCILEVALSQITDTDSVTYRQLSFIIEQLQLMQKKKHARQYSPQLTIFAYLLHATSSAAYSALLDENVLCLPSVNTLKKVTRRISSTCTNDNSSYLKLRISKLNEYERTVLLIVDEVYVAKRVEYSGGSIHGLTTDGSVASTLLCFMIKSVASKYRDIVAIYPVNKLTAEKQNDCYVDVMSLLRTTGANVVAISVDNAATNRKFFTDYLCGGKLSTCIFDSVTGQPIYLIFDPVHAIKNVYNNFQSRKVFECPPMERNLPEGSHADFKHVTELYNKEATMSLKKAHRLTPATLQPKSIEKTSVKLAVSVFCESTRDALRFYAENEAESSWSGTADFVTVILKLWNVLNVKTSSKGKRKRDYTMDPVRSSMDWKLQFLREFAQFLEDC